MKKPYISLLILLITALISAYISIYELFIKGMVEVIECFFEAPFNYIVFSIGLCKILLAKYIGVTILFFGFTVSTIFDLFMEKNENN